MIKNSSFGLSVYTALLDAVSHRTSSESLMELIRTLQRSGTFDIETEMPSSNRSFLSAWIVSAADSSIPTRQHLEELTMGSDLIWKVPANKKSSILFALLSVAQDKMVSTLDRYDDLISFAIEKSGVPMLEPVRLTIYGDEMPLMEFLLRYKLYRSALDLAKKGFRLDAPTRSGRGSFATQIGTVELWNCFLEQGGDPFAQTERKAVWEHLYQEYRGVSGARKLTESILDWVSKNNPRSILDFEMNEYWKKLDQYNAPDYFRSRSDWPTLQDGEGRTPMMLLVAKNGNHLKHFWTVKKSLDGLLLQDKKGRNIWAYLMSSGKTLPREAVGWMIKNNIPIVKDFSGRGLLSQVVLDFSSQDVFFVPEPSSIKKFATQIVSHPEDFWGGVAQQKILASWLVDKLYWGRDVPKLAEFMVALAEEMPVDFLRSMDVDLLGHLALFSRIQDVRKAEVKGFTEVLLDCGAALSSEILEEILKNKSKGQSELYRLKTDPGFERGIEDLARRFEKNLLTKAVPSPSRLMFQKRM